ncbi:GNAT family N-acetyltransferase [Lentibacillus salicampi]|uniref:GNAT family N-acetyltransferase n=1 Tax=Lentibacillus salicampi TaxID=175306 RepID=A0A4Y9A7T1_9BACI|nr:GNAT family N-acetyltransferase [Lentibacillus salicampi]TFJ91793.1 GNAT family N-acetyltransferase [Lentibacillus salicampi]
MSDKYRVVTLQKRPELIDDINELHSLGWAQFMREDPISVKYWDKLLSWFPEYQYLLLDDQGATVACGNSIPFHWDGTENGLPSGWDGVFEQGILDNQNNIPPNKVSALAIVIHPDFQGKGLSEIMVREMKSLVKKNQFHQMIAPVRPSLKPKYPLIPMKEYAFWKRKDGKPFDPWLRTHHKTGGQIMCVAEKSMVIPATIQQWETWTGMAFPASGKYVILEGLVPLEIDYEKNYGIYVEPNVWMKHRL